MPEGPTEGPTGRRFAREGAEEDEAAAKLPSVEEALGWVGSRLDEVGGGSVGRVEGVYVDAEDGEPRWLLVRMGRFGHHSALPFEHAVAGVGHVWVPYDRDAIRCAPRLEPGAPLNREQELELCRHFAIREGTGRAGALATRDPGSPTARPVHGSALAGGPPG